MGKNKKDNFLLSIKHAKRIRGLSDEDAGKLLKSIFSFAEGEDGKEYELSERADLIFDYIKEEITEASEKYEKTCEKRKNAVKKRWNDTSDTNVYKCMEKHTSDTDNECDNDNDNGHNSLKESMCVDTGTRIHKGKAKAPEKCAYGIFRNVYLTDGEYQDLCAEVGEEKLNKAILMLSARIEKDSKYKNDSHAAVIRLWVLKAVEEDEVKSEELNARKKKARGSPDKQADKLEKAKVAGFDFDFEEIFENP